MSWVGVVAGGVIGSGEVIEIPVIWVRMQDGMSPQEQLLATDLAKALPNGGRASVVEFARARNFSTSVAASTVAKLIMAGVISTRGSGYKGSDIRVLDKKAWEAVARFPVE